MARIRTLKPEAWQDRKVRQQGRDQRLLFVGLITMADDEGRLHALPATTIGNVYPGDEDVTGAMVEGWLIDLERSGLIVRYDVDGDPYVWLPGWSKHQKISHPSKSTLPPPPETLRSASADSPETLLPYPDPDPDPGVDPDPDPRQAGGSKKENDNDRVRVDQALTALRPVALAAGQQLERASIERAVSRARPGVDVLRLAQELAEQVRSGTEVRSVGGVFVHRCEIAEGAPPRTVQNGVSHRRGCGECDGGFVVDDESRTATRCAACAAAEHIRKAA